MTKILRKWNEQNLAKLGPRPDVIAQFLTHPWYSPRQETIITAALKKAGVDPNLFLENANKALTRKKEDTSSASLNCWPRTQTKSHRALKTAFFAR